MSQNNNETVAVLTAAIQRVRDLHKPIPYKKMDGTPIPECWLCHESYPCPTIKVLDGEQE